MNYRFILFVTCIFTVTTPQVFYAQQNIKKENYIKNTIEAVGVGLTPYLSLKIKNGRQKKRILLSSSDLYYPTFKDLDFETQYLDTLKEILILDIWDVSPATYAALDYYEVNDRLFNKFNRNKDTKKIYLKYFDEETGCIRKKIKKDTKAAVSVLIQRDIGVFASDISGFMTATFISSDLIR